MKIEWTLLTFTPLKLPNGIHQKFCDNVEQIESAIRHGGFDYVIWRPDMKDSFIDLLVQLNQKCIAWVHNIPSPTTLRKLANSEIVKSVIFVGHEALDLIRDHPVINKSNIIYNGFDSSPYLPLSQIKKDVNSVVYLGSLHPAKCFHLLAQAWPQILKKNPNAKLTVIGSGALYDRKSELGPFGLAEKSYEKLFSDPLLDKNGVIHSSVHFAGLLGHEKIPIMQKASVGVINPHGKSEICPGSAIEFQACRTPVVAGARYGNLDTVKNKKTGFLVGSNKELIAKILHLLDNPELVLSMGNSGTRFVEEKFSQEKTVNAWTKLFQDLTFDKSFKVQPMKSNWLYNFKFVFEILRIIKFRFHLLKKLPSLYEIRERQKGNN
ncbi:glycosyltransferase family 4 protein [Marinoscillum sp.]|uniref:glycosyltransferase family 4 protein n=1 Tax=Marinoscillum sp. TaxID=2024838 RepID=UPI003BAC46D5